MNKLLKDKEKSSHARVTINFLSEDKKTISKFGLNYTWSREECLLVKIKGQGCFETRKAEQDFTCSQPIEMYSSTDGREFKVTSLAV